MSGTGGSGSRSTPQNPSLGPREGQSGGSADPCDLVERTNLNSPKKSVISALQIGAVLDVDISHGPPTQLLAKYGSQVAGSITSQSMHQIINCIKNGYNYQAVVIFLHGGNVRVEVSKI